VTLVGEVGTGKTTLLHALLASVGSRVRTAFVWNTLRPFDDVVRDALDDFGAEHDTKVPVASLCDFIRGCAVQHTTAALVIDEAQNLSDEAFETLRLVSNYETWTTKLLNIALVGQPELETRLQRPHLRQLAERIAIRCQVNPLGRAESRQYLAHRLRRAGGSPALFTPAAIRILVAAARGIPRRLNILAHNALLTAYGRGAARVTRRMARAAVRDWQGRRLVTLRPRVRAPAAALLATGTVACAVVWYVRQPQPPAPSADVPPAPIPQTAAEEPPAAPAPPEITAVIPPAEDEPAEPAEEARTTAVDELRPAAIEDAPAPPVADRAFIEVPIPAGSTVSEVAQRLYGDSGPSRLARIQQDNPQIANLDRILAGTAVRFAESRRRFPR